MIEFIRARWEPVGEGNPGKPTRPGVGMPGHEQKQKRNKLVSRPDPNDKIYPAYVLVTKPDPHWEVGRGSFGR